ncbi:MAG: hypothetical protein D4Q77_01280 [Methanothrix sp.]|nr:MAG: hypothetical protein D4Q77_01280 [Methanothrix sp.]
MNQKTLATISVAFIAGLMIFSSFAGFVMRGGDSDEVESTGSAWSPEVFGVDGRLIDWDFLGIGDALGMYPEDLVFAYWIDLNTSQELIDAARFALPPSLGMLYGSPGTLYPSKIERLSWAFFDNGWAELHWVKPYPLGTYGLAIYHDGYQMIPLDEDLFKVMGMPVLFGPLKSVENVLDVISNDLPTSYDFTLPYDECADLQVSALGGGATDKDIEALLPMGGGYLEYYLGASPSDEGYVLTAKFRSPNGDTERMVRDIAEEYGLEFSPGDDLVVVRGQVDGAKLTELLSALTAP